MAEDTILSEYNEAGNQILRLHNIWISARTFREGGQLNRYKSVLESSEIELTNDIENGNFSSELKKLNDDIEKINKPVELYKKLVEKEKFLRKIQEKAGKGGKYRSPDEDDLD